MEVEVHVLDPEAQPFHETHPCPVEQAEEEPVLSGQASEDIPHLRLGQYDGQAALALGPDQTFELTEIAAENRLIKKEKGAQRLALSGSAHPPLDSQVREEGVDFPSPISAGCRLPWKRMYLRIQCRYAFSVRKLMCRTRRASRTCSRSRGALGAVMSVISPSWPPGPRLGDSSFPIWRPTWEMIGKLLKLLRLPPEGVGRCRGGHVRISGQPSP